MTRGIETTNHRREYHILFLKKWNDPYSDEGVNFYPKYKRGYKNPHKQIYAYQRRMYRTWKYNRKRQWK
jgi:hypothetical protein